MKLPTEFKLMLTLVAAAAILLIMTSCTTASVRNETKDGRVFEASVTSCVWDRQIKGLKFDYENGTLEVETFNSSTDKATAGKALDVAGKALDFAKHLAP